MVEEQGKQEEEKFDFTREGEALGYISMDQARVMAMRTASETPGAYGSAYRDVPMGFEVVDSYARSQQVMMENDWKDLSRTWLAPNDGHPNHRAHQYLAQLLYDELVSREPTAKLFAAYAASSNSSSSDSIPVD